MRTAARQAAGVYLNSYDLLLRSGLPQTTLRLRRASRW